MYRYDKDFRKVRNKIEGMGGEIQAAEYLKSKKYKIIEQNYTNRLGEIDIIALDKKTIVFVEVKKRSTFQYGRPIEAVDMRKQQKIKKVAEFYLMLKNMSEADVRFDVIEIMEDKINHEIDAFR